MTAQNASKSMVGNLLTPLTHLREINRNLDNLSGPHGELITRNVGLNFRTYFVFR